MFSALAWTRARALASAHGHVWARWCTAPGVAPVDPGVIELPKRATAETVASATRAAAEANSLDGTGTYPVEIDGVLAHTTGTGRVRWFVAPDGATTVEVTRPAPRGPRSILFLTMDVRGNASVHHVGGAACVRHWEALRDCAVALGVERAWKRALPLIVKRALAARAAAGNDTAAIAAADAAIAAVDREIEFCWGSG